MRVRISPLPLQAPYLEHPAQRVQPFEGGECVRLEINARTVFLLSAKKQVVEPGVSLWYTSTRYSSGRNVVWPIGEIGISPPSQGGDYRIVPGMGYSWLCGLMVMDTGFSLLVVAGSNPVRATLRVQLTVGVLSCYDCTIYYLGRILWQLQLNIVHVNSNHVTTYLCIVLGPG